MAPHIPDGDFVEYMTGRSLWLRRVAFLLCQDWDQADDLAQTAMTKLYAQWPRASGFENLDAYLRTILVNTYLSETRRPWWRRLVSHDVIGVDPLVEMPDVETALDLRDALTALPPRQRTTIVLRYYCDVLNEGPANVNNDVGVSAYPPSYDAALRSTSNADPGVFLTVTPSGDADDPACHPGGGASIGAGIGGLASVTSTQSQGPTIDGQPSTWSDIVAEGQYDLTWQTSDGSTITLSMTTAGLDGISSASAQADVTHIAESLQVGDISLPLPIQIKGVPAAAEMQVGQIAQAAPLSGTTGATYNLGIALTFGTGNDVAQAGIEVYPASSTAEIQTHETGSCAIWAGGTPNGLKICVTAQGSTLAAYLPGGVGTLLSDIVSLGTDQANWSPNLVIDTK